jgi:hypothetical protein
MLRLKISQEFVGLSIGGDAADDDLPAAAVGELQAVRAVGFQKLRLFGRQMKMAGEHPFRGAWLRLLIFQIDVQMPNSVTTDEEVGFKHLHLELLPCLHQRRFSETEIRILDKRG